MIEETRIDETEAGREAWIARVIAQAGIVDGPLYSVSAHHRGEESPPVRLARLGYAPSQDEIDETVALHEARDDAARRGDWAEADRICQT